MKRSLLLIAAISILGCSSDDDNKKTDNGLILDKTLTYKHVAVKQECESDGGGGAESYIQYCVTDETFNTVDNNMPTCTWIVFKDVDGVERTGFYAGKGSGAGCYRNK